MASNNHRLAVAKAHGSLQALHLRWIGTLPSPLSAFLSSLAILGFPSLMDHAFVKKLEPSIGEKLEIWPEDHQPLDLSPMSPIAKVIIEYFGVQVCSYFVHLTVLLIPLQPCELTGYTPEDRVNF
jgi:hypothetical protein